MITLTVAEQVKSQLGGSVPQAYEKFILSDFVFDVVNKTVNASCRLTSTSQAAATPITGTMQADLNASTIMVSIPNIGFTRRFTMSAGQKSTLQGYMDTAQNNLESGLVSMAIIAGTQATGA